MLQDETELMLNEKLYLFSEVAKTGMLPYGETYMSIWRYTHDGRVNRSGVTVFLGYLKTPSGLATSKEACQRFIRDLNT